MKHNPADWFEIYVQDMPRARAFYQDVFQVSLEKLKLDQPEMWAFPMNSEQYGCSGALVHFVGMPSGGNSTIVYFACEDCAVQAARVAGAGGKIMRDKMSIGEYGSIALAFDTEGNMFGLHSMK